MPASTIKPAAMLPSLHINSCPDGKSSTLKGINLSLFKKGIEVANLVYYKVSVGIFVAFFATLAFLWSVTETETQHSTLPADLFGVIGHFT